MQNQAIVNECEEFVRYTPVIAARAPAASIHFLLADGSDCACISLMMNSRIVTKANADVSVYYCYCYYYSRYHCRDLDTNLSTQSKAAESQGLNHIVLVSFMATSEPLTDCEISTIT
jgi:hypothetical protein